MTAPHQIRLHALRLGFQRLALVAGLLCLIPAHGLTQTLTITNYPGYVNVHYLSIPNKINTLQGAWVYPTNVVRYTNLVWTNLNTWPPLPAVDHVFFKDYSVTNRVTNRFRIYRVKT